jgi:hypothetical protein
LGLKSKRFGERFLKSAEQLRNRLAHAQNLVSGSSWTELISLAEAMETLLILCEEVEEIYQFSLTLIGSTLASTILI